MAKPTMAATLQVNIKRLNNFLAYLKAYLRKNNPIKMMINQTVAYVTELMNIKKKIRKIEYRINYERYKLKKTELILAQNSEHVFLRGRSLNQTR